MISAEYYQGIYLFILTIISLFVFRRYAYFKEQRFLGASDQGGKGVIVLCIIMALFIGFRPINVAFVDMRGYAETYWALEGSYFHWKWDTDNKIFDNLIAWIAANRLGVSTLFIFLSILYFSGMAVACSMLFPKDKMAAYLICLSALSTFSYSVNGMKAGVAASLFLIALAFNDRDKKWPTILFILLSFGFHHAMQLPVVAFFICKFVKHPKYFLWLWILCLVMAMAHVTFFMHIFENLTDEKGAGYLSGLGNAYKGFRFDFVLYSSAPVVIGQIALKKKMIESRRYEFLLNLYTLVNAIWLLCMYAEFNNRISYLSWFMFPIVLIFPFLRERWGSNQYPLFRSIAYGHLCFTLLMEIVYYGFFRSLIR